MIDVDAITTALEAIVGAYEKSAPTVSEWANDLYIRVNERPEEVRLVEILMVRRIRSGMTWMDPSSAANQVYKLMNRLGQDTRGHFGF